MKNLIFKNPTYLLLVLIMAASLIYGCKTEPDYKIVRQQVMDLHDKVMGDAEQAVNNKMLLDSLSKFKLKEIKAMQPDLDTASAQKQISSLIGKLVQADEGMMDWMHNFQPDIEGKSNKEAIKYFKSEMVKIENLDKIYKKTLIESDDYLKNFNLKSHAEGVFHDHSKHK